MNASQFPQLNVASLPPPEAAVVAALGQNPQYQPKIESAGLPFPAAPKKALFPVLARSSRTPKLNGWKLPTQAAPVLVMALNSRWQSYRQELEACQQDFSENRVHELRVATRRLMAQLVMLSCVTGAAAAEKARRKLKRRLKALGDLRDAHVLRLFAQRQMARFPELLLVRDFLERRERRLEKSVAAKVKKFKTRKLKNWVLSLGEQLTRSAARARRPNQLTDTVMQATTSAYREVVRRRVAIDPAAPRTIHRTRIAFKKFRYMVEALSPEFTGFDKSALRALARYQRRMGNFQDLEVMQRCVSEFTRRRSLTKPILEPFCLYLQKRRRQARTAFLRSADELYRFWPPAEANGHSVPALDAA